MSKQINWNDQTQDKLVAILVEDWDASDHLAQEAVSRLAIEQEDNGGIVEDFTNMEDLAEFVHETQRFWDE